MSHCRSHAVVVTTLIAGITLASLSLLTGCGAGESATSAVDPTGGSTAMTGIVHGGMNPISGATITLYFTGSSGYGAGATAAASTTTATNGTFTLPNPSGACPTNGYAYIGAYGGNTGGNSTNKNSLLLLPIGACSSNYASSSPFGYTGGSVFIDEVTTAASAYALGNFMTLSNSGITNGPTCGSGVTCQINIGAPTNNTVTASASTPSTAGLAHAFANALALVNTSTGQANTYMNSANSGGAIPTYLINTLGNIMQACVNSNGATGTNTATSNDGTACGQLFSFTAAPSGVTATGTATGTAGTNQQLQATVAIPTNTLQAMINLAKFPIPSNNISSSTGTQTATWNSGCTAAGSSSTTSACLFGLAAASAAYANALTSAPPDWSMSVVYTNGYGAMTGPGLTYPYYVALDYMDNVYVLNWNASSPTMVNIVAMGNNGTPQFASAELTLPSSTNVNTIGLDTANHVFGFENPTAVGSQSSLVEWGAVGSGSPGAALTLTLGGGSQGANSGPSLADPLNNIYALSTDTSGGISMRKFLYNSSANYTVSNITTTAPTQPVEQLAYGTNLDFYAVTGPEASGSVHVLQLANTGTYTKGTPAAGNYGSSSVVFTAYAISGSSSAPSYGIGGTSAGNAIAFDYSTSTTGDAINLTKTSATTMTVGSTIAVPIVPSASSVVSRAVFVDGLDYAFSPDGAGGGVPSGISVFDSTDNSGNGIALGTYRGCLVISPATTCSTSATAGAPTASPMLSPRGAAIDSSGDVWVVAGNSESLTELIGVAAPAWPALSLGLRGEPQ